MRHVAVKEVRPVRFRMMMMMIQLRYSVSHEGRYAAGSKYYLPYRITSVGGLNLHPLSPKAVGVQNPPPLVK